jgi:hypothetical protein
MTMWRRVQADGADKVLVKERDAVSTGVVLRVAAAYAFRACPECHLMVAILWACAGSWLRCPCATPSCAVCLIASVL